MSKSMNQQILLKSYPTGEPEESNFALVETAIPEPGEVIAAGAGGQKIGCKAYRLGDLIPSSSL